MSASRQTVSGAQTTEKRAKHNRNMVFLFVLYINVSNVSHIFHARPDLFSKSVFILVCFYQYINFSTKCKTFLCDFLIFLSQIFGISTFLRTKFTDLNKISIQKMHKLHFFVHVLFQCQTAARLFMYVVNAADDLIYWLHDLLTSC